MAAVPPPLCFRTPAASPVVRCAASSTRASNQPDPSQHRPGSGSGSGSSWWTPLFGWSSDPDYITPAKAEAEIDEYQSARSRRVCFTDEKAKELRKKTMESSNFHDIMYHSAIASRLASDVSGRQGQ